MNTVDFGTEYNYKVSHERITSTFGLNDSGLYHLKNPDRTVGQSRSDGYVRVTIDGEQIYEHILVYFLFHGTWPDYRLSHWDGDRSNNGIKNLVEEGEIYIRMSKYIGVRFDPATEMWIAKTFDLDFEDVFLGYFDTEIGAALTWNEQQLKMFGENAVFLNKVD